jgi:hypothetical protein
MSIQRYRTLGDKAGELDAARRTLERVEKLIVAEPDPGDPRFKAMIERAETRLATSP